MAAMDCRVTPPFTSIGWYWRHVLGGTFCSMSSTGIDSARARRMKSPGSCEAGTSPGATSTEKESTLNTSGSSPLRSKISPRWAVSGVSRSETSRARWVNSPPFTIWSQNR